VLCEQAAEAALPGRTLIIRPGLIVGPYDPTDRFTYWPRRIAQGGEVLAPGNPDQASQFIDGRDLAAWIIAMVEAGATGVYNADGPTPRAGPRGEAEPLTMGAFLTACKEVSGSDATFTWVPEQFIIEAEVQPWSEVPMWVPAADAAGFFSFDLSKAIISGLRTRPVTDIIRDTLTWDATLPADRQLRAGITRERETELLRRWHAQTKS
jgi:2'-hydroxyisoflavone reductase